MELFLGKQQCISLHIKPGNLTVTTRPQEERKQLDSNFIVNAQT